MIVSTVECVFEDFLLLFAQEGGDHQGIFPNAAKARLISRFALNHLSGHVMNDIRPEDLERMQKCLMHEGISRSILSRLMTALKQMFELAFLQGIIKENPCDETRRFTVPASPPIFFTESENAQILEAIRHLPNSAVFATMMMTGIPLMEILGLGISDADFHTHEIHVHQRLQSTGEGKRIINETLNGIEYSVFMSEVLEEYLLSEIQIQEKCRMIRPDIWNYSERLLFTDGFGCSISPHFIQSQYSTLRRTSGVKQVCMRTLRSNYIMGSLMVGGSLPETARQSGMARTGSILRYYDEARKQMRNERRHSIE